MKNWKKWLSAGLLSAVLGAAGISAPATVSANAGYLPYDRIDNLAPEETMARVRVFSGSTEGEAARAWKKIDGVCYNGSGKKIDGAITRGIDVSQWQETIDWKLVKKDVDFAFIRLSYGLNRVDSKFDYNMTQAEAAGVPVGTYVYSLAKSNKEALAEAQLAIQKMKGHKVSYPVVFDMEDERTLGTKSKREISQIALTFCDEIRKAGYTPMLYMNLDWYNNFVDWSVLEGAGIDVWIAYYGDHVLAPSTSTYKYTIWQGTAGDEVSGMASTKNLISGISKWDNVDVNFGFVDYTAKIVPRWQPQQGYTPAAEPPYQDKVPMKNGWVTEGSRKYYYENNVKVTGWKRIDGKCYYFSRANGAMYRNKLRKSATSLFFLDKNGVRVSNQFVTQSGKKYYFGYNGMAYTGMKKIGSRYYYFNPKTFELRTNYKYIDSSGNIYYFDKNGIRVQNKFYSITVGKQKLTYYFDRNGKAYKGWHTIKGKKYYFYNGTGAKAGVRAQSIKLTSKNRIVSVFNKDGVCTKQYKA